MGLPIQAQAGPQNLGSTGSSAQLRVGSSGELIVADGHARYTEGMYRGIMFSAANQAAQAVSVALNATYTGLLVYNPIGSKAILVPNKVKFALSVAPAAIATIGLICGFQSAAPTGLTALTVRSNQIGNGTTGAGVAYSAATIATPVWLQQLADGFTAAALPAPSPVVDLEGLFGILPGGFMAIGALTAVTGLGSISWEEIPL